MLQLYKLNFRLSFAYFYAKLIFEMIICFPETANLMDIYMNRLTRNAGIDALRFIGISMIILAHVSPEPLLFQFRNFDVPLMLFVSGLSINQSSQNKKNYMEYLFNRFRRLVFPVWAFFTVYFSVVYFLDCKPIVSFLSENIIFRTFALTTGIGYVWIIRVFLCVAILSPFILSLSKKITPRSSLLLLFFILLVNEIIVMFSRNYIKGDLTTELFVDFFEVPPFIAIFWFGLVVDRLKLVDIIITFSLSVIVLLILALVYYHQLGYWAPTQLYKYPPTLYYITYSLVMIIFLFSIRETLADFLLKYTTVRAIFLFISSNTMWIYLWYITLVLYFIFYNVNYGVVYKYFIAYGAGITITYLQFYIVNKVSNVVRSEKLRHSIKMIFTG